MPLIYPERSRNIREAQFEQGGLGETLRPQVIFEQTETLGLPQNEVLEAFEVLDGRGCLNMNLSGEGHLLYLTVTNYGFGIYGRTFIPNYDSASRAVALDLVNPDRNNSNDIVEATELPAVLVEHVLRELGRRSYIGMETIGDTGLIYIHSVSLEPKRWLRES
jgi:hypothetical protein